MWTVVWESHGQDYSGRFRLGAEFWVLRKNTLGCLSQEWTSFVSIVCWKGGGGHGSCYHGAFWEEVMALRRVGCGAWVRVTSVPSPESYNPSGLLHARCSRLKVQSLRSRWVDLQPLAEGLIAEGTRVMFKWPKWEGFPYMVGLNSMWFLFPFKLYAGWDSFLSLMGHSCPDVVIPFFCFCREVFFFPLEDIFLPPKENIRTLCPLDCDLQCWQFSPLCHRSQPADTIKHCYAHNAALWSNLNKTFLLFILLYIIYINTFAI